MEFTIFIIVAFTLASTTVLGFMTFLLIRKVSYMIDLQRKTLNLSQRERHLHEQENHVLLSMLDAEARANQSKLEAYMIIYQETLADVNNAQKEPQYRKLGDMIQMQPSLRRDVYVKNTHRLDMLGEDLAKRIVAFYTDLPEEPEYKDIEPDAETGEVKMIVQSVLKKGQSMSEMLNEIIEEIETKIESVERTAQD